MNTNVIHNFLNIAIAVVSALAAFDWTSIIAQPTALKIIGGLAMAKLMMNAIRDGLAGMVKPQPPVT